MSQVADDSLVAAIGRYRDTLRQPAPPVPPAEDNPYTDAAGYSRESAEEPPQPLAPPATARLDTPEGQRVLAGVRQFRQRKAITDTIFSPAGRAAAISGRAPAPGVVTENPVFADDLGRDYGRPMGPPAPGPVPATPQVPGAVANMTPPERRGLEQEHAQAARGSIAGQAADRAGILGQLGANALNSFLSGLDQAEAAWRALGPNPELAKSTGGGAPVIANKIVPPEEREAMAGVAEQAGPITRTAGELAGGLPPMFADPISLATMPFGGMAGHGIYELVAPRVLAAIRFQAGDLASAAVGKLIHGSTGMGAWMGLDTAARQDWSKPEQALEATGEAVKHGALLGTVLAGLHMAAKTGRAALDVPEQVAALRQRAQGEQAMADVQRAYASAQRGTPVPPPERAPTGPQITAEPPTMPQEEAVPTSTQTIAQPAPTPPPQPTEVGVPAQRVNEATESIAGVAWRDPRTGQVYTGMANHPDLYEEHGIDDSKVRAEDEGFVTSAGRFVNRAEAADIARAAGQSTGTAPLHAGPGGEIPPPLTVDASQLPHDVLVKAIGQAREAIKARKIGRAHV